MFLKLHRDQTVTYSNRMTVKQLTILQTAKKTIMRRFLTLLVAFVVFGVSSALAQTKQVSGKVVGSDDNLPIPGVNVYVKEVPTVGAATDANGNYTIKNVPVKGKTLVFRFVGYQTLELPISESTVNASLKSEAKQIEEVMVVAYGTAKKSTFTGSAALVSDKQLTRIQASDPTKALEGALAGVSVISTSGQPGQATQIRVRGIGSINSSNEPLIIVDGAPFDGSLNSISSNDIESMNVLKDAASAALYGARGANGVIIVTTKKGKNGVTNISFNGKVGYNYRGVEEYNIMKDPKQYYEMYWESLYNQALYTDKKTDDASRAYASNELYTNLGYNAYDVANNKIVMSDGKLNPNAKIRYKNADWNNWGKYLYEPKRRQDYNITVSKGNDKSRIYFSAGYLDDKGFSENSFFERYSSRISYDTDIYSWLNFGSSVNFSRTESNWTQDGGSYTNTFSWTRNIAPIYPIFLTGSDGNVINDVNGMPLYDFGTAVPGVNGGRAYGAMSNLVATQNEDINNYLDYYLNQTAYATIKLPYNVTFTTNASVFGNWATNNQYTTPIGGSGLTYNGISTKSKSQTITYNFNQILRWDHKFEDLTVQLMAGHETYNKKYDLFYGSKSNFLDPENNEWANAAKVSSLTSYSREYLLEGYFGQTTFDFRNKYYLSGSLRRDGSSVFHKDNRWGTFWSIGSSWRVSEEDLIKNINFIDNLKVKASYGAQGNDYLFLANSTSRSYTPFNTLYEVTSNGTDLGLSPKYLGNRNVTWEKNMNFNVGLEFSIFKGKLAGEVEFFNKKTDDLLFNLPVAVSTGFTSKPTNIGSMRNQGFEISLNSNIIAKDNFKWFVNANLTHYKNEVTKLPSEFKVAGITRGSQKILEGGSVYDFYLVKWAGVDSETGDALYWTKNASSGVYEISKTYDANSRQKIGTAIPDVNGGFGTTVDFHNFDISLQFAYQIGGLFDDQQYGNLMHTGDKGDNWHMDIYNRWTPTNKNATAPRVEFNNQQLSQSSDRFITDASYFSFKNATLGYTIPSALLKKVNIKNLRVYFVADNVLLFSKRKGMDPRVAFDGIAANAVYSPIRTMSFGLTLNL